MNLSARTILFFESLPAVNLVSCVSDGAFSVVDEQPYMALLGESFEEEVVAQLRGRRGASATRQPLKSPTLTIEPDQSDGLTDTKSRQSVMTAIHAASNPGSEPTSCEAILQDPCSVFDLFSL
jgi:hypothetical protein